MERTLGYVPGGDDCTQWIFEGAWSDEMKQPLIDVVTKHVQGVRARNGFDVTNWFRFNYNDFQGGPRLYFCRRFSWRFSLDGLTPEALAQEIQTYFDISYSMREK